MNVNLVFVVEPTDGAIDLAGLANGEIEVDVTAWPQPDCRHGLRVRLRLWIEFEDGRLVGRRCMACARDPRGARPELLCEDAELLAPLSYDVAIDLRFVVGLASARELASAKLYSAAVSALYPRKCAVSAVDVDDAVADAARSVVFVSAVGSDDPLQPLPAPVLVVALPTSAVVHGADRVPISAVEVAGCRFTPSAAGGGGPAPSASVAAAVQHPLAPWRPVIRARPADADADADGGEADAEGEATLVVCCEHDQLELRCSAALDARLAAERPGFLAPPLLTFAALQRRRAGANTAVRLQLGVGAADPYAADAADPVDAADVAAALVLAVAQAPPLQSTDWVLSSADPSLPDWARGARGRRVMQLALHPELLLAPSAPATFGWLLARMATHLRDELDPFVRKVHDADGPDRTPDLLARCLRLVALFDAELVDLPGIRQSLQRAMAGAQAAVHALAPVAADAAAAAATLAHSRAELLRLASWHPDLDAFARLWAWRDGALGQGGDPPPPPPPPPPLDAFERLLAIKDDANASNDTAMYRALPDRRKAPKLTCDPESAGRLLDMVRHKSRSADPRVQLITWWYAAYAYAHAPAPEARPAGQEAAQADAE